MLERNPTSYYANLLVVSQVLRHRYGLDTEQLFAEVGIDLKAVARGDQRIEFEAVDAFWALAVKVTNNPCLGLEVVDDLNPALYKSAGVALLCSTSLRDFFLRFERFYAVFSTLETAAFEVSSRVATFSDLAHVPYSETTRGCHADAFAAFTVKLIRLIYRPDYSPLRVSLAWTPPEESQSRYPEWFGCPVDFGSDDGVIVIDLDDLDVELPGANPEVAMQNDKLALAVLEKMNQLELPEQVYARLIEFLPSGNCSRERVAFSLHMSESAFQKKLKSAGTSYQELLDGTRAELAKHHLTDPEISVDEVAYLLGFSDCSNFTRAFKRWLGMSPRDYRNSLSDSTLN